MGQPPFLRDYPAYEVAHHNLSLDMVKTNGNLPPVPPVPPGSVPPFLNLKMYALVAKRGINLYQLQIQNKISCGNHRLQKFN